MTGRKKETALSPWISCRANDVGGKWITCGIAEISHPAGWRPARGRRLSNEGFPVLVVEADEASLARPFRPFYLPRGYTASAVGTPDEANEVLVASRDPHVILMDAGQVEALGLCEPAPEPPQAAPAISLIRPLRPIAPWCRPLKRAQMITSTNPSRWWIWRRLRVAVRFIRVVLELQQKNVTLEAISRSNQVRGAMLEQKRRVQRSAAAPAPERPAAGPSSPSSPSSSPPVEAAPQGGDHSPGQRHRAGLTFVPEHSDLPGVESPHGGWTPRGWARSVCSFGRGSG